MKRAFALGEQTVGSPVDHSSILAQVGRGIEFLPSDEADCGWSYTVQVVDCGP